MDTFGLDSGRSHLGPAEKRRVSFFEQRTFILVIGFFVVASLLFGVYRLYSEINEPFSSSNTNTTTSTDALNQNLLALAGKDTDSDGLSDFEELYQVGTSPYLADSDSDGVNDLSELNAGTNPNCPEGQQCTGFLPPDVTNPVAPTETAAPDENLTASAIRETLKASGAPEYLLDATSDEELLNLYQQVAGGEEVPTNASTPSTLETLRDFTAADIRELLASTGADASLLEGVSDEDLKDIFDQALEEQSTLFTEETSGDANTNSTGEENTNSTP